MSFSRTKLHMKNRENLEGKNGRVPEGGWEALARPSPTPGRAPIGPCAATVDFYPQASRQCGSTSTLVLGEEERLPPPYPCTPTARPCIPSLGWVCGGHLRHDIRAQVCDGRSHHLPTPPLGVWWRLPAKHTSSYRLSPAIHPLPRLLHSPHSHTITLPTPMCPDFQDPSPLLHVVKPSSIDWGVAKGPAFG